MDIPEDRSENNPNMDLQIWFAAWCTEHQGVTIEELANMLGVFIYRLRMFMPHSDVHQFLSMLADLAERNVQDPDGFTNDEGEIIPFPSYELRLDPDAVQIWEQLNSGQIPDTIEELDEGGGSATKIDRNQPPDLPGTSPQRHAPAGAV